MAKTDWSLNDTVQPQDMNDIGEEINQLRNDIDNIDVPPASLTQAGIVQLNDAINDTSTTTAATANAVKKAYDRAEQAFQLGNERKAEVVAALVAKGISASTSESWDSLIAKMEAIIKATGNATSADVLSGKTFSNLSGNNLTGSMPNRGAGGTVTPGTTNQTKAAGYYSSAITVLGDADLVAANIRAGVDIFGVVGNLQPRESYYYEETIAELVSLVDYQTALPFVPKTVTVHGQLTQGGDNIAGTHYFLFATSTDYTGSATNYKTYIVGGIMNASSVSPTYNQSLFIMPEGEADPNIPVDRSKALTKNLRVRVSGGLTLYNVRFRAWA